jgi:hypothetical protein
MNLDKRRLATKRISAETTIVISFARKQDHSPSAVTRNCRFERC